MEETNTPLTEEQKMRRRVARSIARTFWRAEFKGANPEASKEEFNKSWNEVRKAKTKVAMIAIKSLEKDGFKIAAPANLPETEDEKEDA